MKVRQSRITNIFPLTVLLCCKLYHSTNLLSLGHVARHFLHRKTLLYGNIIGKINRNRNEKGTISNKNLKNRYCKNKTKKLVVKDVQIWSDFDEETYHKQTDQK